MSYLISLRKSLTGLVIFLAVNNLNAQDSLQVKEDSVPVKKTKLVLAFDARFSSVHDQSVKINGLKLGWERHEKNRYGIGIYSLKNNIRIDNEHSRIYNLEGVNTDTLKLYSNMSYFVIFWDRILKSERKYEITLNMELGTGAAEVGYLDESELDDDGNAVIKNLEEVSFGVLEFSFQGHYKVFPWIGPGIGLGYRTVFGADENVNDAFSGPVIILKVKVFLGPVYRAVFKPKKKEEKD